MAEIDTSSYGKGYTAPNPLETLSNVAKVKGQLNQNMLFQQDYNSKLGLSQIYKDAIDPQTGQLDPEKMRALMAGPQGGNVTLGMPEAIKNSQEAQGRNLGIEKSQIDLARQNMTTAESYLSPLLAHPNPSSSEIAQALSDAMTKGHLKQEVALDLYSSLPRGQNGDVDEAKIRPWLQQQQMRMMDMKQRFDAMNPVPQAIDAGNQIDLMRLPQVGQPSQAGVIEKGLPPTTPVFNSQTNQMEFAGSGGGRPGASGGMAAAPPLGASEAAGVDATASAQQGVQLQQEADQVPAQKSLLGNLEGALSKFEPGPGQDWKNEVKKFANINNPFGNIFDPSKIASQEEFNKQATQLAQAQFKTLGGTGTDSKLDSAMHTSPNEALSKMGNKGIIAMLKGNVDAIAAKNQAWQTFKQSHGPQSYGQFSTEFNKTYDPRVFQTQYLTPDDNKKMLSGMTKAEQKAFYNSYRTALENQWVKLPGGK